MTACQKSATVPSRHVVECPGAGPFQATIVSWFSRSAPAVLGGGPTTYPGLPGITRDYPGLPGVSRTLFLDTCFAHRFSHRSGSFLGPSWHRFWIDFGEVLEVENDANNDLDENVKMVFSLKSKTQF